MKRSSDTLRAIHLDYVDTSPESIGLPDVGNTYMGTWNNSQWIKNSDGDIMYAGTMSWQGIWATGSYYTNDVVRDGLWTMIANTKTQERPAPQPEGDLQQTIPDPVTWLEAENISVVRQVHDITFTEGGWIKALQVRVPEVDVDLITKITVIDFGTNEVTVVNNPVLIANEYTTIAIGSTIVTVGAHYIVYFDMYNAATSEEITGQWNSSLNDTTPAANDFGYDDTAAPTYLYINYIDDTGADRRTDVDNILVDSIIDISEAGDITRNFRLKVTAVNPGTIDAASFTVDAMSGAGVVRDGRLCNLVINSPITKPTKYNRISDLYSTNLPYGIISTKLFYDGVQQPVSATDAYGINIVFQQASVSSHWDLVALSGDGGAGVTFVPFYEYTKAVDVTIPDANYVDVAEVKVDGVDASTYEYKFSASYTIDSVSNPANFRYSIDGGVNWDYFSKENKDASDITSIDYFFPKPHNDGDTVQLKLQAAKSSASNTMVVTFADVIIQKVK